MVQVLQKQVADTKVERIAEFSGMDLLDLCAATEDTLNDNSLSFNIGFNWKGSSDRLESYWRGVLLAPGRALIVGRLQGVIAASVQLLKPAPHNHTRSFSGTLDHHFVAPWARGYGLAKALVGAVEKEAKDSGLSLITLSVRENLLSAIRLYEQLGYKRWGTLEKYEKVEGVMLSGHFYCKEL